MLSFCIFCVLLSQVLPAVILNKIEPNGTNNINTISIPYIKEFEFVGPTSQEKLSLEHKKFWYDIGDEYLKTFLGYEEQPKRNVAKNVIIFVGDGMGIPTITAARIFKGQKLKKSGEEHKLVFENFPNVGLVKTYAVDMTIPDSAATATALFTGVKTRYEALGVDVSANKSDPNSKVFENSKVSSIMAWAQSAQKDTGIITTTRITHATPAATYAHIHHRDWECDSEVPKSFQPFVKDIARQLIEDAPGNQFKVILGGGYQQLGHVSTDLSDGECTRTDGLNLTQAWIKKRENLTAAFVTTNEGLQQVNSSTDYLLGLFGPDHLPYELLRNKTLNGTPSLSEMTRKGIDILKKSTNGFVLLVEGGKIDLAHHDNYARLALEEAIEFEKTIAMVLEEFKGTDTLILVTADHSHTFTINGYSERGNDILGFGVNTEDDKPGLTVSYANGPGFGYHYTANQTSILGPWKDPRTDLNRLTDPKFRHLATFDLEDETHGGEDVAVFATGPGSHLIRGVFEQNYIGHLISFAGCMGPRADLNLDCRKNGGIDVKPLFGVLLLLLLTLC